MTWGPGNRGSDAAPKSWPRNPRIIDTEEQYRSKEARREAVRLDAGLPKLFYQGYRVDLSRGRLGAQTTIVRTLGVSDHVYTLLALIGTVAASALGSGWLIQLLAWWKKKKTGGQPAAPPSSQAV